MFLKDGYKHPPFSSIFNGQTSFKKTTAGSSMNFGALWIPNARVAFADTFAPFDWGFPWSFSGAGSNNGFVTMNPYPTGWFSPSAKKKFICSQENMYGNASKRPERHANKKNALTHATKHRLWKTRPMTWTGWTKYRYESCIINQYFSSFSYWPSCFLRLRKKKLDPFEYLVELSGARSNAPFQQCPGCWKCWKRR